ncbi:MAG: hypothetical protein RLZZ568_627 [Cyanobacteriota bacterium]
MITGTLGTPTFILGLVLALCIGISLGLMGGGGSILAVPILIYVMGVDPQAAIAMSLAIVGVVSLIGAVPHWKQNNISFKIAALFAPAAMIGAVLGAQIALLPIISSSVQLFCFGIMMVVAAIMMIRKSSKRSAIAPTDALPLDSTASDSANLDLPPAGPPWLIPLQGLGVGILTGFVGIGGGFMIIPALVLVAKIPMKKAVGTSLLIIAANSATGFWKYYSSGLVSIDVPLMVHFTFLAAIGILLGSYASRYLNAKQLEKGFGYFVLAIAALILVKGG